MFTQARLLCQRLAAVHKAAKTLPKYRLTLKHLCEHAYFLSYFLKYYDRTKFMI